VPQGTGRPNAANDLSGSAGGQCPPGENLFGGDRIDYDVAAPMRAGMQACQVRPAGPRPGELLREGALMTGHVRELSALLELA
jgi:FMN phosphatase YigB (HAD superfamily)